MDELTPTLLIAALLVVILTAALVWVMVRTRAVAEMEIQELNRSEATLREEMAADAERYPDDGTVIDWDDEWRRRRS